MKFPRRAVHDCFRYGQRQQRQRAASSSLPIAVNSESFRGSTAETWYGRRAAPTPEGFRDSASMPNIRCDLQETTRKSAQCPVAAGWLAASSALEFWLYPEVFAACHP